MARARIKNRDLIRRLKQAGFPVKRTNSDHLYIDCPSGVRVHFSNSPSDGRSDKNAIAMMRRNGVNI